VLITDCLNGDREEIREKLSLEKTKKNLWITVLALLAVVILLSLSLSIITKKERKIIEKS